MSLLSAKKSFQRIIDFLAKASPEQLRELCNAEMFDKFLQAIAEPRKETEKNIYEYLLTKKPGLTLLAQLRNAISANYSQKGKVNGLDVFVSPHSVQWFKDGVMFLQGKERFQGLIGLYQDGKVKFAVSARDIKEGEKLGPEAFLFLEPEDYNGLSQNRASLTVSTLDRALEELESLLQRRVKAESSYQLFLEKYPWVLGGIFEKIQSKTILDDRNVPDYSAVRARDKHRDIIEIKSPFMKLFGKNNEFTASFYKAYDQAQRYLHFARENKGYLWGKGLLFQNPHCYLILGFNLQEIQLERLRWKEGTNPAITIYTFNDLLTLTKSTVNFIKDLHQQT